MTPRRGNDPRSGDPGDDWLPDGSYYSAWFSDARALVSDGEGTLYVADTATTVLSDDHRPLPSLTRTPALHQAAHDHHSPITQGTVSTFAGSGTATNTDGTGTSAAFNSPRGEAIIGNTLYVLDADAIRAVSLTNGAVSTIVGPASSGGGNYTDRRTPPTSPSTTRRASRPRRLPLLRRQRQHQAHRSCDGGDDDGVASAAAHGWALYCWSPKAPTDLYAPLVARLLWRWPSSDTLDGCDPTAVPRDGGNV